MAIEESVLTLKGVESLINKKYGISDIQDIIHINNSSANCYHVICTNKQYFFKEIQSKYSIDKIRDEVEINDFLKKRNIPTSKFYKTVDGEYLWEYKKRVFHLQEYITGKTYKMNTAPEWLISDSAIFLSKIQKELSDYPRLEDGFGENFFLDWDIKNTIQLYKNLIENLNNIDNDEIRLKMKEDLDFKLSILPRLTKIKFQYNKFTVSNSHGDFGIFQILSGEGKINGIVDFTSACSLPICWEIIRSYTYADPQCANGEKISIKNLKNYLNIYLQHNSLSTYDLKMMPYLYYYHLVRSRFGYREYILSNQSNKEELLEFAFWRTNMCRWLDKNVELLSQELMNEFQ